MAMVVQQRRKRCRFCGDLFPVDRRLKGKQFSCSRPECQLRRKQAGQERWLARNPDYFKGRYPKVKAWLKSHPDYLAQYRRKHPEKATGDNQARKRRHLRAKTTRADIQVASSLQVPVQKALMPVLLDSRNADIQVLSASQVVVVSLFSAIYLARARADIQDPIATAGPAGYAPQNEPPEKTATAAGAHAEGAEILQLD
jgi:hypothetical protein